METLVFPVFIFYTHQVTLSWQKIEAPRTMSLFWFLLLYANFFQDFPEIFELFRQNSFFWDP